MTTPSNAISEFAVDSEGIAHAYESATRPIYWSVRRELWENRSIYVVPLAVAAFILIGFGIYAIELPGQVRALSSLDPAKHDGGFALPYCTAPILILLAAFAVGVAYCLDALSGERHDRSILFWKSLPVSDLTTVLAKASIPLLVLPALVFAIVVATQMIMLALSAAVLIANGVSVADLWTRVPLFGLQLRLLYALAVMALWHAPLYAWLLLVSGWARRPILLWVVLPPLVICIAEERVLGTSYAFSLLSSRLMGWSEESFVFQGALTDQLPALDPARFLTAQGLWIGLVFAAGFLAAASRVRRHREPI